MQPGPRNATQAVAGSHGAIGQVHYWPAYEMIKECFSEPYLEDGRHVKPECVQQVLQLFGKYYLKEVGLDGHTSGNAEIQGKLDEG